MPEQIDPFFYDEILRFLGLDPALGSLLRGQPTHRPAPWAPEPVTGRPSPQAPAGIHDQGSTVSPPWSGPTDPRTLVESARDSSMFAELQRLLGLNPALTQGGGPQFAPEPPEPQPVDPAMRAGGPMSYRWGLTDKTGTPSATPQERLDYKLSLMDGYERPPIRDPQSTTHGGTYGTGQIQNPLTAGAGSALSVLVDAVTRGDPGANLPERAGPEAHRTAPAQGASRFEAPGATSPSGALRELTRPTPPTAPTPSHPAMAGADMGREAFDRGVRGFTNRQGLDSGPAQFSGAHPAAGMGPAPAPAPARGPSPSGGGDQIPIDLETMLGVAEQFKDRPGETFRRGNTMVTPYGEVERKTKRGSSLDSLGGGSIGVTRGGRIVDQSENKRVQALLGHLRENPDKLKGDPELGYQHDPGGFRARRKKEQSERRDAKQKKKLRRLQRMSLEELLTSYTIQGGAGGSGGTIKKS